VLRGLELQAWNPEKSEKQFIDKEKEDKKEEKYIYC